MMHLDFKAFDRVKGTNRGKNPQLELPKDAHNCQKVYRAGLRRLHCQGGKALFSGAVEIGRFIFITESLSCVVGKAF